MRPAIKAMPVFVLLSTILASCVSEVRSYVSGFDQRIIAVQPFTGMDQALVQTVAAAIDEIFSPDTILVLDPIPMPKTAFVNIKSPRYRADTLIAYLRRNRPPDTRSIIGLTDKDISVTKKDKWGKVMEPESRYADWGIFGLGYRPGPSCVVSTFRIKGGVSKAVFTDRLKKIAAHEVGHNLGLPSLPGQILPDDGCCGKDINGG
jgi:archaemetzincin